MQPVFVVRTWHNEKATNMGEKKRCAKSRANKAEVCFFFFVRVVVASHLWDVCLALITD